MKKFRFLVEKCKFNLPINWINCNWKNQTCEWMNKYIIYVKFSGKMLIMSKMYTNNNRFRKRTCKSNASDGRKRVSHWISVETKNEMFTTTNKSDNSLRCYAIKCQVRSQLELLTCAQQFSRVERQVRRHWNFNNEYSQQAQVMSPTNKCLPILGGGKNARY